MRLLHTVGAEMKIRLKRGDRIEHAEIGCIGTVLAHDGFSTHVKWDQEVGNVHLNSEHSRLLIKLRPVNKDNGNKPRGKETA